MATDVEILLSLECMAEAMIWFLSELRDIIEGLVTRRLVAKHEWFVIWS
jgi:hypothetical protein